MILTVLRLNKFFVKKYKLNCGISSQKLKKIFEKTPKIALKLPKSPYFFTFWEKNLS